MEENIREKELHAIFEIGILLKGFNGVLEVILGTLLIFTDLVNDLIVALAQNELIENSNDFFASHLNALANPSHQAQVFSGMYLVTHGVVKIFLVAGLLRDKLWAYPAAITFISLFVCYQIIRITHTHSILLSILTTLDMFMVWVIYHEYRRKLKV